MDVVKIRFCKWCRSWVKGVCHETGKITDGSDEHSGGCMK